MSEQSERIQELKEKIREIKLSWPAHNPSPVMFTRLEELEDELERLQMGSQGGELSAKAESGH